ncbi:MAG: TIGR02444 family protein [Caulobacteraceae bacterium]|nr:TIGR02444 family protein [Caulobacteraceae bacterium]
MTGLWAYAVALWEKPAVRGAALVLQDRFGQCVPLLLWRLWTINEGLSAEDGHVGTAIEIARGWEGDVAGPLRTARERLRAPRPGFAVDDRLRLKDRVGDAATEAERLLLQALEGLTSRRGPPDDVYEAVANLCRAWNGLTPEADISALLAAAGG